MLTTLTSVKRHLGIVEDLVEVQILAKVEGDEFDITITGDGEATIEELLGVVDYDILSGGSVILGYEKTLTVIGGSLTEKSEFTGEIGNAVNDMFLLEQMEEVNAAIEGYCGRIFGVDTYIETFYRDERLQKLTNTLQLFQYPIIGTPVVQEIDSSGNVISSPEFRLHTPTGTLSKSFGIDDWFVNAYAIRVTYDAGYAVTPPVLRSVMNSIIEERWNRRQIGMGLNFGPGVQSLSIPGVMNINFDFKMQGTDRKNAYGIIVGNYLNALDPFRSERRVVGSIVRAYVS